MSLHPSVNNAIDEIDAAFFSGDEFHSTDNYNEICNFVARWTREILRIEEDRLDKKIMLVFANKFDEAVELGVFSAEENPVDRAHDLGAAIRRLLENEWVVMVDNKPTITDDGHELIEELINGS